VVTSHEQKQEVLHNFYSNLLGYAPPEKVNSEVRRVSQS
jgi:hypothetical protein